MWNPYRHACYLARVFSPSNVIVMAGLTLGFMVTAPLRRWWIEKVETVL